MSCAKNLLVAIVPLLAISCRGDAPPRPAAKPAPVPTPIEAKPAPRPVAPPIARDLQEIAEDGTLKVLFTFNTTGYFIYRGETMGYEYELLSRFAEEAELRLRPVLVRDSAHLFEKLNRGEGDLIAAQLAASPTEEEVLMTDSLYSTTPVVVQRGGGSPTTAPSPTLEEAREREEREATAEAITIRARLVTRPRELGGEQVHLAKVSPYRQRLLELNTELADDIEVVQVDESTDKLIQRLAHGDIAYTVAAENVATLRAVEYKNLVIRPAIGPPQPVVWALRTTAPNLHTALNRWLAEQRESGLLNILYDKYFEDRRGYRKRVESRYLTPETGRLSPYDEIFYEHARIPVWDWRLIAAQSYQESRFDPAARSWAGAIGLMQIMPRTARELRVDPHDPEQSVEGACRYLDRMDEAWKESVASTEERIKFTLASYNVGLGHVQDAVRLAEKNGDDPASWDDVAYWLLRKSKRAVYNDPVCRHGFARGTEPVAYVDSILGRWEHYREFVTLEPAPAAPAAGSDR